MIIFNFIKVNDGVLIMNGWWGDLRIKANFEFNREILNFVALRYGLESPSYMKQIRLQDWGWKLIRVELDGLELFLLDLPKIGVESPYQSLWHLFEALFLSFDSLEDSLSIFNSQQISLVSFRNQAAHLNLCPIDEWLKFDGEIAEEAD